MQNVFKVYIALLMTAVLTRNLTFSQK